MSHIIAVSSSKGGPGKTTTVASLADCWALSGYQVALIDSDPNKNLTKWYEKQVFAEAFQKIELKTQGDEEKIIEDAENLATNHDIVLIDVAGVKSKSLLYAAGISDLVIVPAQPSEDDIDEALNTIEAVKNAAKLVRRDIPYRVLLTQTRKGTIVLEHTAKQFEDMHKIPIFRTLIGNREAYKQARFHGTTVSRYDPKGDAAREVYNLAAEVMDFLRDISGPTAKGIEKIAS